MIQYDPKNWLKVIFRVRGSVLPRLLPRIVAAAGIGLLASVLLKEHGFKIPAVTHTLMGAALGLLLVFRTNASFDRWWEGRKLLGSMVNRSRDLVRQAKTLVADPSGKDALEVQRLVSAFYALMRQHLRGERDLDKIEGLTKEELAALEHVKNRPAVMGQWISAVLVRFADEGKLTEQRLQAMDANLTSFNDALGACERILRTPVPFAYAQHIKIFVTLFCLTAPFAMAETMRWYTSVASAVLSFAMFGIDELGVEIEDPFGYDPNDLPLDAVGHTIDATTKEIAEVSAPKP